MRSYMQAVRCHTVSHILCVQVSGLGTALQVFLVARQHSAVSKIRWPTSLSATTNFSRYSSSNTASQRRLRRIDDLMILPDCSVMGVSKREAEYLLRADRSMRQQGHLKSMTVAVTHLAFLRWMHPATVVNVPGRINPATFSAVLPWHAFGAKLSFPAPPQHEQVARNVLATQLFNGETDYEQQGSQCGATPAGQNRERKRLLGVLLFEPRKGAKQARDVISGVKQVVEARQRKVYWEGSSLASVCNQEADKLQFKASK